MRSNPDPASNTSDSANCTTTNTSLSRRALPDAEPRAVYGCDLILLRPDLHVAWRGNRLPDDAKKLAAIVTGH